MTDKSLIIIPLAAAVLLGVIFLDKAIEQRNHERRQSQESLETFDIEPAELKLALEGPKIKLAMAIEGMGKSNPQQAEGKLYDESSPIRPLAVSLVQAAMSKAPCSDVNRVRAAQVRAIVGEFPLEMRQDIGSAYRLVAGVIKRKCGPVAESAGGDSK
jgi:hypothetical protein